jgi:hypothetical protein
MNHEKSFLAHSFDKFFITSPRGKSFFFFPPTHNMRKSYKLQNDAMNRAIISSCFKIVWHFLSLWMVVESKMMKFNFLLHFELTHPETCFQQNVVCCTIFICYYYCQHLECTSGIFVRMELSCWNVIVKIFFGIWSAFGWTLSAHEMFQWVEKKYYLLNFVHPNEITGMMKGNWNIFKLFIRTFIVHFGFTDGKSTSLSHLCCSWGEKMF